MSVKRWVAMGTTALLCAVLMAGCSGGSSSSSANTGANASSSSSSVSSSASSSAAKDDSSGSSSSSRSSSSSGSSSSSSSSSDEKSSDSDDFDRALIGTWHIYSKESGKNLITKTDPELVAWMRSNGTHDTLTFFSDGTVEANRGGGTIVTFPWFATDGGTFEIDGMLDDPAIDGDPGEEIVTTATVADNRLTLEYDTPEDGHVKLVYSKS